MDISALMSALQDEQAKKSSVRLSDRNVVELVMKLKQLGIFGDELLHTINGKEYITTDRLKADIQTALRQAGGRLELTELPALVGVDLVHCEKQAALIVDESKGRVLDAQGELITTQYFDSLAAEVNDMLQESGVLSLADLAVSYALNTELLRSTISSRMGTIIVGQLEGSLLHTPAYVRNIKAQLRGALRGTAAPVALPALLKGIIGLDSIGGGSSAGMLSTLVDELLAEGAVQGSTKGGGGSWVPSIHTATQQSAVAGFYSQNGWVAYDLVRKAGISSEKAYLAQKFPEGVALSSVFVSPTLIAATEAAVDETLRNGAWLDVATVLPPSLGPPDVAQLLDKSSSITKDKEGKQGQVLAATCVVSAAIIAGMKEKAEAFAKQEAEKALQGRGASNGAAAASSNGAAGGGEGGSGRPSSGGGTTAKKAAAGGADSDDDWSMGSKGKGKKGKAAAGGGGGGKGKAAKGAGGTGGAQAGGSKQAKGAADVNALLSVNVLAQLVLELHPDMEAAGPSGDLPSALAEVVRPTAVAAYQEAMASVFTSGAVARKRAKDAALKALEEAFSTLQLYASGCGLLQADEAALAIIQRHLLRSTGSEALDLLLTWCQHEFADDQAPGATPAAAEVPPPGSWTPAERSKLVKALPAEVGQPLARAVEAAGGVDPQEFVAELDAAAQECGIRLKRLDKKAEKAALSGQRTRLMGLLHGEQAPAAVLALVLPLLVLKTCSKLVSIPGRAIGGVLAMLQPQLEEGQFVLVQGFHEGVVASLKAASGGAGDAAAAEQQLAAQVQQLKALVGVDVDTAAPAQPEPAS